MASAAGWETSLSGVSSSREGGSRLWHIRQSILSSRPIAELYHYSHESRRILGQCERLSIRLPLGSKHLVDQCGLKQECYPRLLGGWTSVYRSLRTPLCKRQQ